MNLMIGISAAVGGYVLSIYTWTPLRAFVVGAEQELAWVKERASELEAKVRAALGRGE